MAASVGEYIAYSVGAFLACVSRVRATRGAMRCDTGVDGCARARGAVVVPLWFLEVARKIPNARVSETRD